MAFFFDHGQVDLPRRVVAIACQFAGSESFVMAEVQVGLGAVIEHVDFAVLVGAHGAGIDVDVRIQLLHSHAEATLFKQHSERGGRQAFAERANDAAGHKDMFGHGDESYQAKRFAKAESRQRCDRCCETTAISR